jgi:FkbM family methyltransferase
MLQSSSLRSSVRDIVPFSAWQMAGFLKRLPNYWRMDRSEALRIRERVSGLPLYITRDVHVFSPENLTTYIAWKGHGVDLSGAAREPLDFLELGEGCHNFIDIGAQTGFMSALFARSRSGPTNVLSVEPDPQVLPILKRAAELNSGDDIDWKIETTAVSNSNGHMTLKVTNFMYEHATEKEVATEVDVPVTTLKDLLAGLSWQPDIIKIDVESFEHEILCSSLELIEKLKPRLQLEVHWRMLEDRGRDALDFLGPLSSLGYRGPRGRYRNLDKWLRAGRSEIVSRIALRAD